MANESINSCTIGSAKMIGSMLLFRNTWINSFRNITRMVRIIGA